MRAHLEVDYRCLGSASKRSGSRGEIEEHTLNVLAEYAQDAAERLP